MKKSSVLRLFDPQKRRVTKTAEAVGLTRQAVYCWPEDLPQETADRVVGAALRMGIDIWQPWFLDEVQNPPAAPEPAVSGAGDK